MKEYIVLDEGYDLLAQMDKDSCDWVLLVGSAVSIWSPSNIPNGQQITEAIHKILNLEKTLKNAEQESILRCLLERLPFELLMDRCPIEKNDINNLLINFFKNFNIPNPVHSCLAELFISGKIASIITPNYDICLENAIEDIKKTITFQYQVVTKESDVKGINESKKCIFKIHGSVDDPSSDLIFLMNQEGKLPKWKSDLLKELIAGKNILIIGYSGYDFDICPELVLTKPNKLYWNFFKKKDAENSLNAQQIATHVDTDFLCGDMRHLLSKLLSTKPSIDKIYSNSIKNLQDNFKKKINNDHIRLWGIRILNTLNFNGIVLQNVNELLEYKNKYRINLLREKAIALVNSGRYKQGALLYSESSNASKDKQEKNLLVSLAEHSWLSNGAYIKYLCSSKYRKRKDAKDNFNSQEEHNVIQFYSYIYKLKLPVISQKIRSLARKEIEKVGRYYHEKGVWHGIFRLQILAEEFNIPSNDINIIGLYKLVPIKNAYQQVTFPIGEMMAFRKSLENCETNDSNTFKVGENLLNTAIYLEIYAEVWKLANALDKFFPNPKKNYFKEFWIGLDNCEYSFFKKTIIIVNAYYIRKYCYIKLSI